MPTYLIGFSYELPKEAEVLVKCLLEKGATCLWSGLWSVDLDFPPENLDGFLASEASFSVPANDPNIFYQIGRAASSEARTHFFTKIAPQLHPRFSAGDGFATVRYCNEGEAIFSSVVSLYNNRMAKFEYSTDLCHLMMKNGSDKALGWHTYTPFYKALFEGLSFDPCSLLEIGIGTNYIDTPSNMGVHGTPGASLRGWRDFFPKAQVFGGDVDTRVLFSEARIETFFVDQLRPATFAKLFESVGLKTIDVIVDDGLHTFEAANNSFQQAYSCVSPGGLYVIEDVACGELDRYLSMVEACGCDGFSINIPHVTNKHDNCLVVARGR